MNHQRTGSTVQALAALVGISTFVLGLPVLLTLIGQLPNPGTWTLQGFADLWTQPDDGTVFLAALTCVAWAGWFMFTLLIAVEAIAHLGNRPAMRIPGMGWAQGLAAGLVSTVVVGLSSGTAMAATPTAVPIQEQAIGEPSATTTATEDPTQQNSDEDGVTTYTVQSGDTYWSIAEAHLGAGERYTEIVDANRGEVMVDGQVFTGDEYPNPGWELRMPGDATSPGASESAEAAGAMHTVLSGETLSGIAEQHLGDAGSYPVVFDANMGEPQDAGGTLTDPDLIQPGWNLVIPDTGQVTAGTEEEESTESTEGRGDSGTQETEDGSGDTAPEGSDASTSEDTDGSDPEDHPQPVDEESESSAPPGPSADSPTSPQAEPNDEEVSLDATLTADDSELAAAVAPWVGYSALAAAGLSAILLMRRRLQQRDRHPGHRIVQSPDPQVTEAEADLHSSADPATVELLDRALRSLSAKCASTQTPLPHIQGARLGEECELLVREGQGIPVTPFRQVDARTWRVDATSRALLDEENARHIPAPYPGLVTLGQDREGTQILVDLPQIGAVGLTGDESAVTEVLTSLAVELSTSPAADHVNVTCIGAIAPDLAQLVKTGRVRAFADVDACLKELELQTLEYASTGPGDDIAPEVVLSARPLEGQHLDRLSRILGSAAAPPIGLVAYETETHKLPGTWHLQAEGEQELSEMEGTAITLQRLSQESYAQIRTLLQTAEVTTSVPAPGWERVPEESHLAASLSRSVEGRAVSPAALVDLSEPPPSTLERVQRPTPLTEYEVQVRILGKVEIIGPDASTLEPGRRRSLTELACFLKLRPGRTSDQISRSMGGPRGPWTASTRSAHLSKLRAWLGRDSAGAPHFPTQTAGTYSLAASVGCDWLVFQALAKLGIAEDTQRATTLLEEALELVSGEPFSGVGLDRYGWAEPLKPEIHAAMVDVAHTIATRHLRDGFLEAARTALNKVLELDPACELLCRDLIRVEYKARNSEAITRVIQRLHIALDQLDLEMSDDTQKLLEELKG